MLSALNAANFLITEDVYYQDAVNCLEVRSQLGNKTEWDYMYSTLGRVADYAFAYKEPNVYPATASAADTILYDDAYGTYDQIGATRTKVSSTPIMVHTRFYADFPPIDLRYTYSQYALADSRVGALAFEFNAGTYNTPGNPGSGWSGFDGFMVADAMMDTVNAGKEFFILLVPNNASTTYYEEMMDSFDWIKTCINSRGYTNPSNASQSLLHSSSVHFVLCGYGRSTHYTGFITGDNSVINNSVSAAKGWLLAMRTYGSY